MTKTGAAPKCLACVVDPRKGINQHQWLVNKMVAAWRDADPDAEYKAVAQDVAIAFDQEFDPQILKPVYKKGKFQGYETEEARAERCNGRPGNHKDWIDAQRNMAPALLRFQPQPPAKGRRSRASSARDLYVRDHPGIGKDVVDAQGKLAPGDRRTALNVAISAIIEEVKLTQPDVWQRYEEASAREKGAEESEGDEEGQEDEEEEAPMEHDLLARLCLSMRTAIDSWVEQTGAEIFVYMGKVRDDGTSNRSLMSAGKRGRDHLAQRVVAQPLIKTLDDYVLDTGGLTPRAANPSAPRPATQERVVEPLPGAGPDTTGDPEQISGGPQPARNVSQASPDVPVSSERVLRVEHPADGNEVGRPVLNSHPRDPQPDQSSGRILLSQDVPQQPQGVAPALRVVAQRQRDVAVPSDEAIVQVEEPAAGNADTEEAIRHPPDGRLEAPRPSVEHSPAECGVDVEQVDDIARAAGSEPLPLQDGSNDEPAMVNERPELSLDVEQPDGVRRAVLAESEPLQGGLSDEPAAEDDGKRIDQQGEKMADDPVQPAQDDAHVPGSATHSDTSPPSDDEPRAQTKASKGVRKGASRRGRGRKPKSSGSRATLVAPEDERRPPSRGQKRPSPEEAETPEEPSGRPKRAKKQDYASLHRKVCLVYQVQDCY
ncbi:uncharacterized protein B0H18DRAFT_960366 [Fomitopsis serialis]|uniref:uncharacterized protein n=1 Tax=Fomitopsis serialis TaxID=139415 RepID=UPI002007DE66|nr:uncharacterized protein B0H18DRAFT_960366 [Neoantrodia serialis]KAH9913403.1 hypothetical protein B0H18DRAFT_960366 [Neoantrodia serialis]